MYRFSLSIYEILYLDESFFLFQVTVDKKLPSLYLMDSIVKNIGKEYLATVTQCIVALFTHVFEKVIF